MRKQPPSRDTLQRQPLKLGVLRDNMGFLSRVMRSAAQQSADAFVGKLELAAGQLTMLGLIAANEGVTQNELARAMVMRKSQVTTLIQDLVVRGFVSREEDGADRRYLNLALTPAGRRLWKRARQLIASHSALLLSPLDDAEREQLIRLLRKMLAAHLGQAGLEFD